MFNIVTGSQVWFLWKWFGSVALEMMTRRYECDFGDGTAGFCKIFRFAIHLAWVWLSIYMRVVSRRLLHLHTSLYFVQVIFPTIDFRLDLADRGRASAREAPLRRRSSVWSGDMSHVQPRRYSRDTPALFHSLLASVSRIQPRLSVLRHDQRPRPVIVISPAAVLHTARDLAQRDDEQPSTVPFLPFFIYTTSRRC